MHSGFQINVSKAKPITSALKRSSLSKTKLARQKSASSGHLSAQFPMVEIMVAIGGVADAFKTGAG